LLSVDDAAFPLFRLASSFVLAATLAWVDWRSDELALSAAATCWLLLRLESLSVTAAPAVERFVLVLAAIDVCADLVSSLVFLSAAATFWLCSLL